MANLMITAFKKWKAKGVDIDHRPDCEYVNRHMPVDECACDCHELAVFHAGWVAHTREALHQRSNEMGRK